jgi:hypothetical protein
VVSDPAEPGVRSPSDGTTVTVFISYSQDSAEHKQRVLALAQRLRDDGVDCTLDQFVSGSPPAGWPLWMERGIASADFVLVVCTEVYRRRYDGREDPTRGRGATWESILTRQELYESGTNNTKFIPIMFDGASEGDVPTPLRAYTHYRMAGSYDDLLRHVTSQPAVIPSPIGPLRRLPLVHGPVVETNASPAVAHPWQLRIATAREIHSPLLREVLIQAATAGMNEDLDIATTVLAGSFDALRIHVQREYRRARGSDAPTGGVTQVESIARAGDGRRAGAASRSRATGPGPGSRAGSEPPPGDASERVRRAQRTIEAALRKHPQLCKRLAERLAQRPEEVAGALLAMRGSEIADLGAELYLELRPKADAAADVRALESVIFTALPCAADLRGLVAQCPATGERDCDVIELTYRSRAIAEAVVAGWVGRACLFVENSGTEPYGRGAIRAPATTHAPVFMTEEQLRKDVVADFARSRRIERPNPRDLATAVNDWLDHTAVNDRRANDAMIRENAGTHGLRPVRYYYLFRDSEIAEAQERDGWWDLIQRALHPQEGGGLSRLVLVRMTGGEESDENRLDYSLAEIVNKPDDVRDKPPTS